MIDQHVILKRIEIVNPHRRRASESRLAVTALELGRSRARPAEILCNENEDDENDRISNTYLFVFFPTRQLLLRVSNVFPFFPIILLTLSGF